MDDRPTNTPAHRAYGDLRIAPCLARPHHVELQVWDVAPTPSRGGWVWYGEFNDVASALAAAHDYDPEAAVTVEA